MSATKEGSGPGVGVRARPNTRYSTKVRFLDGLIVDRSIPTSVDIFEVNGCWYCQVCRGGEKTRPMGPYSKEQAERVQDRRRLILSKRGTDRLVFEEDWPQLLAKGGASEEAVGAFQCFSHPLVANSTV